MIVYLKFGPPFSKIFGMERVEFELPFAEKATVDEIISAFFINYPEFYKELREDGHLKNDKLKAVIVINRKLSLNEDVVEDGAEIKILSPICGG